MWFWSVVASALLIFTLLYIITPSQRKQSANKNEFNSLGRSPQDLDKAQVLSQSPKAFDAVFFIAISQNGFYIVAGCERRKHNIVNGLFYIVVPGLGLLCSNKIPDTVLFDAKDDTFGAEGLLLQPVLPMKRWKLSYTGEMWAISNPTKQLMVTFNGTWSSELPIFNYDTDLDPGCLASAMANEPWCVEYFQMLLKAHQSHYEQMGELEGSLTIGTETFKLVNMPSLRDHSFGRERDWKLMHRYVFHMIFLENGTKAAVGVICQPATCSVLYTGYINLPCGSIYPVVWCDFKLYQHGECGTPPRDYAFQFKSAGQTFTVEVAVNHESVHYVGWRWEAMMVERFVSYNVNGVKGRGVSEWHYNSTKGRPQSASRHDPAWFSEIVAQTYNEH